MKKPVILLILGVGLFLLSSCVPFVPIIQNETRELPVSPADWAPVDEEPEQKA